MRSLMTRNYNKMSGSVLSAFLPDLRSSLRRLVAQIINDNSFFQEKERSVMEEASWSYHRTLAAVVIGDHLIF